MMSDTKTEQLSVRMSPRAKALLREAARREHRTASNMVEHLVLTYCLEHSIEAPGGSSKKNTQVKA
jgi:uncharacterized protein (DUF1778 family)